MTLPDECIKCKKTADVLIRRTRYCNQCFVDVLKNKFDTAMGQSAGKRLEAKVLVCLQDDAQSAMLLDLSKKFLKESSILTFKKRSFQMIDLVFGHISKSGKTLPNSIEISINEELLNLDWKSNTSKEDVEEILKFRKFADVAIENKCSALLFPETCTDIAIRSISDIALGRGLALNQNIAPFVKITHKDHELLIVRPLFDITDEDVMHYTDIAGLDPGQPCQPKVESIQNATRNFLLQLQKEHSSTINIVTKTCLKLDQKVGDGSCAFCQGPRLESDASWRRRHTLSSSDLGIDHEKDDENQDFIFSKFCYSCQNIMMDVDHDEGVDNSSLLDMISGLALKN